MFYRNINPKEILKKNGEYYVLPKPFAANCDSTIPEGTWSFWFDVPKPHHLTEIIVGADFTPEAEGVMTYHKKEGYFAVCYETAEFVTSQPVKIKEIIIGHDYDFCDSVRDFCLDEDRNVWSDGENLGQWPESDFHNTVEQVLSRNVPHRQTNLVQKFGHITDNMNEVSVTRTEDHY